MKKYPRPLRVWYGWEKMNKIKKHEALCVIYEDSIQGEDKTMRFVNKQMNIVYVRNQTEAEMESAERNNRCFYSFSDRLDDKKFCGSLELLLTFNYEVDADNVSLQERTVIRKRLEDSFMRQHFDYEELHSLKWLESQKKKLFGIEPCSSKEPVQLNLFDNI